MKRVTVTLENENLYEAVELEAARSGRSVDEVVAEALEQWLAESELNAEEAEEIEAARKEWRERGGVEAREFFENLRSESGE